jgi:hypothetical protein
MSLERLNGRAGEVKAFTTYGGGASHTALTRCVSRSDRYP